jgi:hypothetical protein
VAENSLPEDSALLENIFTRFSSKSILIN